MYACQKENSTDPCGNLKKCRYPLRRTQMLGKTIPWGEEPDCPSSGVPLIRGRDQIVGVAPAFRSIGSLEQLRDVIHLDDPSSAHDQLGSLRFERHMAARQLRGRGLLEDGPGRHVPLVPIVPDA